MSTASLAIWNKKKIIVVIVTGVLGTNVIFLIQGKPSLWKSRNII